MGNILRCYINLFYNIVCYVSKFVPASAVRTKGKINHLNSLPGKMQLSIQINTNCVLSACYETSCISFINEKQIVSYYLYAFQLRNYVSNKTTTGTGVDL